MCFVTYNKHLSSIYLYNTNIIDINLKYQIILEQLHKDWDLLLSKLAEKGVKLQQALVLVQFLRQCDEVMFWINDKVNKQTKYIFMHLLIVFIMMSRKLLLLLMSLGPI